MAYNSNIREEEVKNHLRKDYFADYDAEHVLGDIDFAVAIPGGDGDLSETQYLLWAEAKKGTTHDIRESLAQLILTIGKARTFDKVLPPAFLGAFDAEKIAFVPYNAVLDIFYQNDFNWNVTPSNHDTREFKAIMETVSRTLDNNLMTFSFDADDRELRRFIRANFVQGKASVSKVRINKNNFTAIYQKWLAEVKPTIAVNWDVARQSGIIDADFYLADIISEHNVTLRQKLYVLLRTDYYEIDRRIDQAGLWDSKKAQFNDRQRAHTRFWNRYERPPRREYWDYIVERRDLLVPQDIRERKGSFFTPRQWVELSQQYLARELGEDWQEHYYIWDCCGGTGNLEAGLTNKYNIWVSTLDKADVDVIHDRIKHMNDASTDGCGANLLDSHIFQFDFLNDPFLLDKPEESKLPGSLIDVLKDPEKRRRLVIYINPPYAEASNARTVSGTGSNRPQVATATKVYALYQKQFGTATRELFAQFLIRIYYEIPNCWLAEFSKLKILQASNFQLFRRNIKPALKRAFMVPANTFDNVKGSFPIGFFLWNTADKSSSFEQSPIDVYNAGGEYAGQKNIYSYDNARLVIEWLRKYYDRTSPSIGFLRMIGTDMQHNRGVFISNTLSQNDLVKHLYTNITQRNLIECSIYCTIRHVIEDTWLNDRDQFLYPDKTWEDDLEFQTDSLIYVLFTNNVQSKYGANHWIPFREDEVGAQERFQSHFMSDFLCGTKAASPPSAPLQASGTKDNGSTAAARLYGSAGGSFAEEQDLFADAAKRPAEPGFAPIDHLSAEARAVMDAGRELWRYYHRQPHATPNASLYDIRLHFQGCKTTKSGKVQMNTESTDETYTRLIATLRRSLRDLAAVIAPKVYDYRFLLK